MEFKAIKGALRSRLSVGLHVLAGLAMVALLGAVAYWIVFGAVGRTQLVRFMPDVQGVPWVCLEGRKGDLGVVGSFLTVLSPLGASELPFSADLIDRFALLQRIEPQGDVHFAAHLTGGDGALKDGRLPAGLLANGYGAASSGDGVFAVSSPSGDGVGFMAYREGTLLFCSSREGLEHMMGLSSGEGEPLLRGWDVESSWEGHLAFGDGGRLGQKDGSEGGEVELEAAFRRLEGGKEGGFVPAGEARWRLKGSKIALLDSLDRADWSALNFRVASPVALAMGFKVGEGKSQRVPFMDAIGRWLDTLGLTPEGKGAILSSPVVLSLGGRTEVLWLEMPGALLSFPSSGKAGEELAKGVWDKLLLGAPAQPMSGYQSGGYTKLPFSMVAASNGEEAELGLISPNTIRESRGALPEAVMGSNLGWIYANLPELGQAVEDAMGIMGVLGLDDDNPFSEKAKGDVRDILSSMSPVLLVFQDAESGRMEWYNPPKR
ncbi:MAG: hypothetical protein N2315_04260 [Thermanaerothrix sp.]|nr:hypothetical protein [Thermanaerothrix sp.]